MKERLFLAIPVPLQVKDTLASLKTLSDDNIRWVPKENYHITVSFFGSIETQRISQLEEILKDATTTNIKQFSLQFEKISLAPPNGNKTMLWALYGESNQFNSLVESIEANVGRHITLPNFRKSHDPVPHITLARFTVVPNIELINTPQHSIQVKDITLFASKLSNQGPSYQRIKSYALNKQITSLTS